MNISGLLRGFLGELQPSAGAKLLELKAGQIVKGIVLQLLSGQEALMNIEGVQVRARLEVPMNPGASKLFQVQSESVNGQPVLKPIAESQTVVTESALPELLKGLGVKDHSASRQLISAMEQELVPLTKESVSQLTIAMKEKSNQVSPLEWLRAAAFAVQRGLKPTQETVAALRQVLSGPPFYDLIEQLGTEAEMALHQPQVELPEDVVQLLRSLLAAARQLSAAGEGQQPAFTGVYGESPAAAMAGGNAPVNDSGHSIGRIFKALGVEYEHEIVRLPGIDSKLTSILFPQASPDLGIAAAPAGQDSGTQALSGTLKGLLLQLVQHHDVPQALKDTIEQTLQQITGQQLLLTPDSSTPFAHVTLFVPFQGENGKQTASVHIQARRGKRGELDVSNCRLLFDLHMKYMGSTLVDVQVVDRIVSLNVHNDHGAVQALLDAYRDEMAEALQQAGFQLLSLKISAYPEPSTAAPRHSQIKTLIQAKPYRGVDFRV